jgi:hypothetical protein
MKDAHTCRAVHKKGRQIADDDVRTIWAHSRKCAKSFDIQRSLCQNNRRHDCLYSLAKSGCVGFVAVRVVNRIF